MEATTQSPFRERRLWERILYMIFCAIAYSVAEFVIVLIAIVQIVAVALSGDVNERMLRLGRNVGAYARQIFDFVTFNDETVPFPFSDWPDEGPSENRWQPAEKPAPTYAPSAAAPAASAYEAPAPEAAAPPAAAPPAAETPVAEPPPAAPEPVAPPSAPPAAEAPPATPELPEPPASDDEPPKAV